MIEAMKGNHDKKLSVWALKKEKSANVAEIIIPESSTVAI